MYKRKCKHLERVSWWYGRNPNKPEAIVSSRRCKVACTKIFFECEECPFHEPTPLNEDIAEFFKATCERYRK